MRRGHVYGRPLGLPQQPLLTCEPGVCVCVPKILFEGEDGEILRGKIRKGKMGSNLLPGV